MGHGIDPTAMEPTDHDLRRARELVARNLRGMTDPEQRRHEVYATAQTILAATVEDIAAAARRGDWDAAAAEVRYGRAADAVRAELAGGRSLRDIDAVVMV